MNEAAPLRVGLVSDTHGLFDPLLPELFAGCDLILHAGDVVRPWILRDLGRIARVRAVRGNNDLDPAFDHLPELDSFTVGSVRTLLVHHAGAPDRLLPAVRRELARRRARLLVFGHSHRPLVSPQGGVLFVNPGSAGPRRFKLPRTAGLLVVRGATAEVSLFELSGPHPSPLQPPVRCDLAGDAPGADGPKA